MYSIFRKRTDGYVEESTDAICIPLIAVTYTSLERSSVLWFSTTTVICEENILKSRFCTANTSGSSLTNTSNALPTFKMYSLLLVSIWCVGTDDSFLSFGLTLLVVKYLLNGVVCLNCIVSRIKMGIIVDKYCVSNILILLASAYI